MDGITIGGGCGVSVHGSHRVVTEKIIMAMPETGIGYFPDVGASHFLSKCPDYIGLYLGLTGARLNAADILFASLADYFVPAAAINAVRDQIISGDPIETVLLTHQDVAQWKAQYQIEASSTQKQSFETAFAENVPPATKS